MAGFRVKLKIIVLVVLTLNALFYLADCIPLQDNGLFARLVEPPPRKSYTAYQDQELASITTQSKCSQKYWQKNMNFCSACGNVPNENHHNEAYEVHIHRRYLPGDTIKTILSLSQTRDGYMEFRICNNGFGPSLTHRCFENNFLVIEESHSSRIYVPAMVGNITLNLRIPLEVPCDRYVLQWKYIIGDDSNTDCKHCETYINCANIVILDPSLLQEAGDSLSTGLKRRRKRQIEGWGSTNPDTANLLQVPGENLNVGFERRPKSNVAKVFNNRQVLNHFKTSRGQMFNQPGTQISDSKRSNGFDISGLIHTLSKIAGTQFPEFKRDNRLADLLSNLAEKQISKSEQNNKFNISGLTDTVSPANERQIKRPKQNSRFDVTGLADALSTSLGRKIFGTKDRDKAKDMVPSQGSENSINVNEVGIVTSKDSHDSLFPSSKTFFDLPNKSSVNNVGASNQGFTIHSKVAFDTRGAPGSLANFIKNTIDKSWTQDKSLFSGSPSKSKENTFAGPNDLNQRIDKTSMNFPLGFKATDNKTSVRNFNLKESSLTVPIEVLNIMDPKSLGNGNQVGNIQTKDKYNSLLPSKKKRFNVDGLADALSTSLGRFIFGSSDSGYTVQNDQKHSKSINDLQTHSPGVSTTTEKQNNNFGTKKLHQFFDLGQVDAKDFSEPHFSFLHNTGKTMPQKQLFTDSSNRRNNQLAAFTFNQRTLEDTWQGNSLGQQKQNLIIKHPIGFQTANTQTEERPFEASNPSLTVSTDVLSGAGSLASSGNKVSNADLATALAVSDGGVGDVVSNIASGVQETLSGTVDSVKDVASSVADSVSDAVSSASDGMADVVSSAVDSISSTGDVLSDATSLVGDIASNAKDAVSGVVDNVMDAASSVADTTGDLLPDATSSVGEIASNVQDTVSDVVDNVMDSASSVADTAGDVLSDAISPVGEIASNVQDTVSDVVDNVKDVTSSIADTAGDVLSDAVSPVGEIASNVQDTVSDVVDNIKDVTSSIADTAGDVLSDAASPVGEIASNLQDTVSDVVDNVMDVASPGIDTAGDVLSDATSPVGEIASNIQDTVSDTVDSVMDVASSSTLSDSLSSVAETVVDTIADATSSGSDIVSDVNDALPDIIPGDGISDGVSDTLLDVVPDVPDSFGSIGEVLTDAASSTSEVVSDVIGDSKIGEVVSDVTDVIGDVVSDVTDDSKIGDIISDLGSSPTDAISDVVETDIRDTLSDIVTDTQFSLPSFTKDTSSDFVDKLGDHVSDVVDNTKDGMSSIKDNIGDILDNSASTVFLAGGLNPAGSSTSSSINSISSLFAIPPSPLKEIKTNIKTQTMFDSMPPPPPPPSIILKDASSFPESDEKRKEKINIISIDPRTSSPNFISAFEKDDGKFKLKSKFKDDNKNRAVSLTDSMLYVLAGDYGKYQLGLDKLVTSNNNLHSKNIFKEDDRKLQLPATEGIGGLDAASVLAFSKSSAVGDSMSEVLDNVGLGDVKDRLSDITDTASDLTSNFRSGVANSIDSLVNRVSDAKDKIGDFVSDIKDNSVFDQMTGGDSGLKDILSDTADKTRDILSDATDQMASINDDSKLKETLSEIRDVRGDAVSNFKDVVSEVTDKATDKISDVADLAKDAASNVGEKVSDVIDTANDITSNMKDGISDVFDARGNVISNVRDRMSDVVETTVDAASNVRDRIVDVRDKAIELGSNIVENVSENGWSKVLSDVGESVSNIGDKAGDIVSNMADSQSDMISNVKDTVSNVADTASEISSTISDKMSDIGGNIDSDKLRNLALVNSFQNKRAPMSSQSLANSVLDNVIGGQGRSVASSGVNLMTFFKAGSNSVGSSSSDSNKLTGALARRNSERIVSTDSIFNYNVKSATNVIPKMVGITGSGMDLILGSRQASTVPTDNTGSDVINLWSVKNPISDASILASTNNAVNSGSKTGTAMEFHHQTNSVTLPVENTVQAPLERFLLKGLRTDNSKSSMKNSLSTESSSRFRTRITHRNLDRSRGIGPADASSRVGMGINASLIGRTSQSVKSLDSTIGFQASNQGTDAKFARSRINSDPFLSDEIRRAASRSHLIVLDTNAEKRPLIGVKSRRTRQSIPSPVLRTGRSEVQGVQSKMIGLQVDTGNSNSMSSLLQDNLSNKGFVSVGRINGDEYNLQADTIPKTHSPINLLGVCKQTEKFDCKASSSFHKVPGIDWWCVSNCRQGNCRQNQCSCYCISKTDKSKRSVLASDVNRIVSLQLQTEMRLRNSHINPKQHRLAANMNCKPAKAYFATQNIADWCNIICAMGKCPTHVCNCP